MTSAQCPRGLIVLGLAGVLIVGCAASRLKEESVGERFDRAMKTLAERCTKKSLKLGNSDCDSLKLRPADPLATEEGRFAHSIKIPNPVPEDSGYRPGMTAKEYFEHLCRTEAGDFIFQTVKDVDGIYQMRPRGTATNDEMMHLYALEDPYHVYEAMSEDAYVNPRYIDAVKIGGYSLYKPDRNYKFLEKPLSLKIHNPTDTHRYLRYTKPNTGHLVLEDGQYLYPRNHWPPMIAEQVTNVKSRYGFTWRGITRPHDRELGIAGSEVIVLDLRTNQVLAVRRGYALSGWKTKETVTGIWWLSAAKCPSSTARDEQVFIHKVLRPSTTVN